MKALFAALALIAAAAAAAAETGPASAPATATTPATEAEGAALLDPHAIAGIGSSSMFGRGAKNAPFLSVLVASLGTPWWARNAGEPGIHATGCLDRWRLKVRGRGFGSLVVLCGLNDIRSGSSAAATWSTLQVIFDEALEDGLRVVPMTLQPFKGDRAWTPEKHAALLALNASIRAHCEANHLPCVDVYSSMNDPANDGAMQPRYDCGDHLHMNQAAHDLMAREARAAFP